jgi:hypothetical protein
MNEHRKITETVEEYKRRCSHEPEPTITFTPEALKVIRDMRWRCHVIADHYGHGGAEHLAALESFATSITAMLGLGGRITADGDLSLYGVSPTIHFGVNWSPDRRDQLVGTWSVNS